MVYASAGVSHRMHDMPGGWAREAATGGGLTAAGRCAAMSPAMTGVPHLPRPFMVSPAGGIGVRAACAHPSRGGHSGRAVGPCVRGRGQPWPGPGRRCGAAGPGLGFRQQRAGIGWPARAGPGDSPDATTVPDSPDDTTASTAVSFCARLYHVSASPCGHRVGGGKPVRGKWPPRGLRSPGQRFPLPELRIAPVARDRRGQLPAQPAPAPSPAT